MGELFGELFGRPEKKPVTKFSYQARQYESSGLKNTGHKLTLRQHEVEAAIPLERDYNHSWKLFLNGTLDELKSQGRFPNGRPMPNALWDPSVGLNYKHEYEASGHTLGANFNVGSPSDRPFGALRDLSFQLNMTYKVPKENESAWIFFLSFANNRGFLNYVPLPGFAYFFRAHERLRMLVGLPFVSLFWTPFEKTVVSFTYFPLRNAQARVSYFLFGPAHVYLQAKHQSKNYFLSDRTAPRERLFYEEGVVSAGVTAPLERYALADLNFGYSFDRQYFLGEKSSARKGDQRLSAGSAPFASAKLVLTF